MTEMILFIQVRRQADLLRGDTGEGGEPTLVGSKIDPRLTAKILGFVREVLMNEDKQEMELQQAFDRTVEKFSSEENDGSQPLPFRRCQDFDTFLKMHSHLFRVQSGMVR